MQAHLWPALITLGTMLLLAACTMNVGRARGRFRIDAPAMTGPADFERVIRVQANTLENTVAFVPTLWLAAIYSNAALAAVLGAVWLLARIWYAIAYARDAKSRGKPFALGVLAWAGLFLAAGWGLLSALLSTGL